MTLSVSHVCKPAAEVQAIKLELPVFLSTPVDYTQNEADESRQNGSRSLALYRPIETILPIWL